MATRRLHKEIFETARSLYDLGILDAQTMREFDVRRLPAIKSFRPEDIKRMRLKAKTSQAVFAAYLNTSISTVQKWETGEKNPSGPALKLLNLVERKGLKALA